MGCLRSLLKERIRVAVDLLGEAIGGGFAGRVDFVEKLKLEYGVRKLKPLWGFFENPFDEELAFVYAVGKQVAAEEVLKLEDVFALEVKADRAISAVLEGHSARAAIERSMGACSIGEVLAVARLAACYDLLEPESRILPSVIKSLCASFRELDRILLSFKRYCTSLQLAALRATGSINYPPPETLFNSLALKLGDWRAKPSISLANRIAHEIFGVEPADLLPLAHAQVEAEAAVSLDQAGEKEEVWRAIYDQLASRFASAGRVDAKALAAVLVREAIVRGVDPTSIDVASIDPLQPIDSWRRYLNLDWRLNYIYMNIRDEFEIRLERHHDYKVLGRLNAGAVAITGRTGLKELIHEWLNGSGSKPTDVSDEYLRVEVAQLVEKVTRHARSLSVKRAQLPIAVKKVLVSGIPVELNLYQKRSKAYLQMQVSNAPKVVIRVEREAEKTLARLRNVIQKTLPLSLRNIALPLEEEVVQFLMKNVWGTGK